MVVSPPGLRATPGAHFRAVAALFRGNSSQPGAVLPTLDTGVTQDPLPRSPSPLPPGPWDDFQNFLAFLSVSYQSLSTDVAKPSVFTSAAVGGELRPDRLYVVRHSGVSTWSPPNKQWRALFPLPSTPLFASIRKSTSLHYLKVIP